MQVRDFILIEQTITEKNAAYVCMLINQSTYIIACIKLYGEYIIVNNVYW